MKKLLLLLFIFSYFFAAADAQRCGNYSVEVIVQDESGKPVDTAVVQFVPITKDETQGKQFVRDESERSKFSIQFAEGSGVWDFHKLIVSADGYKTAEKEIKFRSCEGPVIKVRLPKKDSESVPFWDFKNFIRVETLDADGNYLNGVKVTIKKDGKILEEAAEYSGTGFSLAPGPYTFRFEKEGFEPVEIKMDRTQIGELYMPVRLKRKK